MEKQRSDLDLERAALAGAGEGWRVPAGPCQPMGTGTGTLQPLLGDSRGLGCRGCFWIYTNAEQELCFCPRNGMGEQSDALPSCGGGCGGVTGRGGLNLPLAGAGGGSLGHGLARPAGAKAFIQRVKHIACGSVPR